MEININQKKISIGDKYQVFIDGQPTHKASREIFKLFAVINLFENNNEESNPGQRSILNLLLTCVLCSLIVLPSGDSPKCMSQ